MGDAYRDQYEAALQQAEALRRENAALRAHIERLQAAPGERPRAIGASDGANPLLLGTLVLSVLVLAGSSIVAGLQAPRRWVRAAPCPYANTALRAAPAHAALARPCPFLQRQQAARAAASSAERDDKPTQRALEELPPPVDNLPSGELWAIEQEQRRGRAHGPGSGSSLGQLGEFHGGVRIELDGALPPGAEVRIDGVAVPLRGRVAVGDGLRPGVHRVRVSAPGYAAVDDEALVTAGVTHTVAVQLAP